MLDFIWIYVSGPSYWAKSGIFNELKWSIESVRKNYPNSRCFVVGDDPKLDVEWIPCPRVENSKYGYYRHFDMIKKVQKALSVTKSNEFVLMYDDIYLLQPVKKRDLQQVYAKAKIDDLNDYFSRRQGDSAYIRTWINTYNRILEFTDELYDFETHLPRYYETDKLLHVIDKFNLNRVAYFVYSLYASLYAKSVVLVTDEIQANIVQDTPLHNDYDKDFSAKYLNISDDGISQEVRNRIIKMFGN